MPSRLCHPDYTARDPEEHQNCAGLTKTRSHHRGAEATRELAKLDTYELGLLLLTRPFNGPLSGTTRVSRYQKGKTNLDFTEAGDSEWQWHRLGL